MILIDRRDAPQIERVQEQLTQSSKVDLGPGVLVGLRACTRDRDDLGADEPEVLGVIAGQAREDLVQTAASMARWPESGRT